MTDERDAAREALRKYGGHLPDCSCYFARFVCACGEGCVVAAVLIFLAWFLSWLFS